MGFALSAGGEGPQGRGGREWPTRLSGYICINIYTEKESEKERERRKREREKERKRESVCVSERSSERASER